jgi:hypothetical protein
LGAFHLFPDNARNGKRKREDNIVVSIERRIRQQTERSREDGLLLSGGEELLETFPESSVLKETRSSTRTGVVHGDRKTDERGARSLRSSRTVSVELSNARSAMPDHTLSNYAAAHLSLKDCELYV